MCSWINLPPAPPHIKLGPKVQIRWQVDPGLDYMDLTPVSDGNVAILGGGRSLAGIRVKDGSTAFRRTLDGTLVDLAATNTGPVALFGRGGEVQMTAFHWNGDVQWTRPAPHEMGSRSLRGAGQYILALGLPRRKNAETVCTVLSADTGDVFGEYPNPGDAPDVVSRGLVCSVRSTDASMAGLFLYDYGARREVRLLPHSHSARSVSGNIVVIDTYDDGSERSELIAVDTVTGHPLWSVAGGPNVVFAADERHVASVVARPGGFAPALRDLASGATLWEGSRLAGRYPTVMLTADAVLVFVDNSQLHIFDRATGELTQTLEEPSTAIYGACVTSHGLIDLCSSEVRCLGGAR